MVKIRFQELSGGMQRGTTNELQKDNEADLIINMHSHKLGAKTVRLGYSQVGDTIQSGKDVNGLASLDQKDGTHTEYAVTNNSGDTAGQLKYNNAGTWTALTSTIVADTKIEFATFINYVFMVGPGTVTQSINGGSNNPSTSTNVTGAPKGKYVIVYKDRLYILNVNLSGTDYPSRFYYSSIPSGSPLAITWDTTNDFEEFLPDDGDEITGAIVAHDRLYIFKDQKFGFWDNNQIKTISNIGCASHRAIKERGGYIFWPDKNGDVWAFNGGAVQKISNQLRDITHTLTASQLADSFSEIDMENYKWYVGDLTIDGVTYNNCELCYHIDSNTWCINSYADGFTVYAMITSSGVRRVYAGADDGEVHKLAEANDEVYTDDGNSIFYYYKSKKYNLGVPEEKKFISRVYPIFENAGSMKFGVKIDGKTETMRAVTREGLDLKNSGYEFQFVASGNDNGNPSVLKGFVVDAQQSTNK